jgi:dipeptidyl aminopeptidase/acylaminoacyl peptidase
MRPVRRYTAEEFVRTTEVFGSSFSPDEKEILFTSNQTGIRNAYSVSVIDGKVRQLTDSVDENTHALSYFPNDWRVLLSRDCGGDENNRLYVRETDGRETQLTCGNRITANFLGWSRGNKSFYFEMNDRDSRFFDIYRMNSQSFARTLIYLNTNGYLFYGISTDEHYIAFGKPKTKADSDIYLYNVDTGLMRHVTPHLGDVVFRPACFDVSSRYLYFVTDEDSEFLYVKRYELESGRVEMVEKARGDICHVNFSYNGKYYVSWADENGQTIIKVHEHETGKAVALPGFPEGEVTAVAMSKGESLMAFYVNGDRSPNDLYVADLTTQKVTRLTNSLSPDIDPDDLVTSRIISYRSFDKLRIPALLWRPHGLSEVNKAPAILWMHGGPGSQTRKGYSGKIQYLVNHGYVVLGVNYRGSSGYGKTFCAADDRKHGREPVWDCIKAKEYLSTLGYVDMSKIGIIGASYGGYMVLAAMAFHPEEFAVGVDMFGVSNWLRTLQSFPRYWEPYLEWLYQKVGDPRVDQEMLNSISPLFHADKISKPLMVLQGAKDPRVIQAESDEIVAAIKKQKGIVEYVLFEDEGHGFTKKANQIRAYKVIRRFLDRYLKGLASSGNTAGSF